MPEQESGLSLNNSFCVSETSGAIKSKLQNIERAVLFRTFVRATEATKENEI